MKRRSKFEDKVAGILEREGFRAEYETHNYQYFKRVPSGACEECESNQVVQSRWYTPDFYLKDYGIYLETKGRWTATDRAKMRLVLKQHPSDIGNGNLVMVFQRNNKINANQRYGDYCDKFGIPWIVINNLEEWLDDLRKD